MIGFDEFFSKCMGYHKRGYLYDKRGYVVWGPGTGGNIEIQYLKANGSREGNGTSLITEMCEKIKNGTDGTLPTRHSVYAFSLGIRTNAHNFYKELGFKEIECWYSIYQLDSTKLFWIPFSELCNNLGVE